MDEQKLKEIKERFSQLEVIFGRKSGKKQYFIQDINMLITTIEQLQNDIKGIEEGVNLAIAITTDETVKAHLIQMLEGSK